MEYPALDEIVIFTEVAKGRSFTAAGKQLGLPKSTVSRKLAELEARVGARLLQRTTRSVSLTDVGRVYHEHCLRILAQVEEATLAVSDLQASPQGLLRVSAPVAFSMLGPILAEYLAANPKVQLELVSTDRRVDLVAEGFDLALRAGPARDSSLIARRLGQVRRRLVAAPSVAASCRRHRRQLFQLREAVVFAPDGNTWELRSGSKTTRVQITPRLTVNDYDLLLSVTRAGCGIALLPEHLCAADLASGALVPVLETWTAEAVPFFALYPSRRHLAPKVSALIELLRARLDLS